MSDVDSYRPSVLPETKAADQAIDAPEGQAVSAAGRRIVTRLHDAGGSDGQPYCMQSAAPPAYIPWVARTWADDSESSMSAPHHNRYVAPLNLDAPTLDAHECWAQSGSGTGLWNKIAKAIRDAWMRPDRERSGCNEQHGD